MFKKSLALSLLGLFIAPRTAPAIPSSEDKKRIVKITGGKGQLRAVKRKSSGAASLKRIAKTKSNIRKHSKKL